MTALLRDVTPDERAWGLMPALARDGEPRFGKLGIDARSAWARSG